VKVNGCPLDLLEPEVLRVKALEPILILGQERFVDLDIRIRVRGKRRKSQAAPDFSRMTVVQFCFVRWGVS